ncbi:iron chaperone [Chryseolinea soli]|nr:DUF1801 domain-containing protein [Chryseolinea soli]
MAKTMTNPPAESIDAYIADFPLNIRKMLKTIRTTIRKAAPRAEETIKYAMPTFTLDGNLIHFAAYQKHIGIYPVPMGVPGWDEALAPYVTGKGSLQLPLDKPMPLTLISKIVKFNAKRNAEKMKAKKK